MVSFPEYLKAGILADTNFSGLKGSLRYSVWEGDWL